MNNRPKSTHGKFEALTGQEKSLIVEHTRLHTRQKEIAILLGRSLGAIAKWQVKLCGSLRRKLDMKAKAEIIALGKTGLGIARTAHATRISRRRVRAVWVANGIRHKTGGQAKHPWEPSQRALIEIIDLVLTHEYSGREISRLCRAPYHKVLQIAHVALECEKFVSGGPVGLDSYLPTKFKSPLKPAESQAVTMEQREKVALYVVDLVRRAAGEPIDDSLLVEVATLTVTMLYARENPAVHLGATECEKIKNYFQPHFQEAIGVLRASQTGTVN